MAGTITDYVYHEIGQGTPDQRILDTVVDRGYTRDYAEQLLARCKQLYPEWQREQRQAALEHRQAEREIGRQVRKAERGEWLKTIGWGVATCVFSVVYVIGVLVIGFALDSWRGWNLMDEVWVLGFIAVGVFAFLGGVFGVLKGLYHGIRWW